MIKDKNEVEKLIRVYYNKEHFKNDLIKLAKNSDQNYINNGMEVYEWKEFRNYFAHRMRLLWWHNKKCSPIDYFIKREVFEALKIRKYSKCIEHVFEILKDHKSYENMIENSDCSELVSSRKILRDTHDLIASFINKSLKFIRKRINNSEMAANSG